MADDPMSYWMLSQISASCEVDPIAATIDGKDIVDLIVVFHVEQ